MEAGRVIMPAGRCGKLILMLSLMQTMFVLLSRAAQEWKTISEEENLEMERQLKVINKPPIKSFQTDHGEILDCIDIYKQHAFDNPLLKDHKIQMRPKRLAKEIEMVGGKFPRLLPNNIRCPPGSVLIKRTTKEDLIMAKKMKALGMDYPRSSGFDSSAAGEYSFASAIYNVYNLGATAIMNLWNPGVLPEQRSFANIWIIGGSNQTENAIQAGWGVLPAVYPDTYTRLMTYWTADGFQNSGCFDYFCPGFVQVSSRLSLGLILNETSVYNGRQIEIQISVVLDGHWWLSVNEEFVGYWPIGLFTSMYFAADVVSWGGQVQSPNFEPSPAMGSGHFPIEGHHRKSAYFKQMLVRDGSGFVVPDRNRFILVSYRPDCYGVEAANDGDASSLVLYYGGPGLCSL